MEFTKKGTILNTNSTPLNIGNSLPEFNVKEQKQTLSTKDLIQKLTLISVVPNINTPVCSLSTRKFNQDVSQYPNANFYTISTNTPAQQQEWCAIENVSDMKMLSDESHEFGKAMGLYIADAKIDARSVWIIDPTGKIIYRELVTELSHEPNYDQVLTFLKNAINSSK